MSGTLNKYNHASLQNVLFYIVLTEYITNNHKLNMTGFFEIYVGGGGCCCGVPTANTLKGMMLSPCRPKSSVLFLALAAGFSPSSSASAPSPAPALLTHSILLQLL